VNNEIRITNGEWPTVRLDDACSLTTDGTHQTPTYAEEGFVFLSSKNVVSGKIDWENVKRIPGWLHTELHGRLSPQRGDLLLAKSTTGVAAVVDRDVVFDIYVSLALLRPKSNVLPEYLHRALNSHFAKMQFNGSLKGIGVPNLHLKDIRRAIIPLPPLAEQRRIAKILDRAEALRAKRRAALAQLDSLTQSLFVDNFGDPLTNPKSIKTAKLGTLCVRVTDGTHQPPKWSVEGHPFLFVSNIIAGEINFDTVKFISDETHTELTRRCPIELGDVLYSTVGSYGVPAIVRSERKFAFQRHIAHLKPNRTLLDSEFLAAMLASPPLQRQADRAAKGVAQKTVNLSEIRDFVVFQPALALQRAFARQVTAVEKLKAAQRASLAELDALFATLQHRAFRGAL
jgi:type I restriction enzyme S subunit